MAEIEIIERSDDGSAPLVQPSWDTVWKTIGNDGGLAAHGDWRIADPTTDINNAGGFEALDPIGSAILIQLFTNRRAEPGIAAEDGSRGGWHGDTYDIEAEAGEGPMGSWLYTLERAALTYDTLRLAEFYAIDALQTLVRQGVADRVEAFAERDEVRGWLVMSIKVYVKQGVKPYDLNVPLFRI